MLEVEGATQGLHEDGKRPTPWTTPTAPAPPRLAGDVRGRERLSSAYTPDPNSRAYVQHLDYWYAQSHPFEDYAETFAVWLRPSSRWKRRYEGWPRSRSSASWTP